jgi:hypothetical protein
MTTLLWNGYPSDVKAGEKAECRAGAVAVLAVDQMAISDDRKILKTKKRASAFAFATPSAVSEHSSELIGFPGLGRACLPSSIIGFFNGAFQPHLDSSGKLSVRIVKASRADNRRGPRRCRPLPRGSRRTASFLNARIGKAL